jgi:hypothetical protein
VLILPYIDNDDLYKQYKFDEPWDGPNNRKLADRMPRVFAFHSQKRAPGHTTTNYLAVIGDNTAWPHAKQRKTAEVKDDNSSTILIVENRGMNVHWMEPRDLNIDEMDFRINNPNGISSWYDEPAVAMVDSSVHRLKRNIKPDVLRALLTINGSEELQQGNSGWEFLGDGRYRKRAE